MINIIEWQRKLIKRVKFMSSEITIRLVFPVLPVAMALLSTENQWGLLNNVATWENTGRDNHPNS
jgi:hypothetical protein